MKKPALLLGAPFLPSLEAARAGRAEAVHHLAAWGSWTTAGQGTIRSDNLTIAVEGLTNSIAPSTFFRAKDRSGQ
jgi:hypothetical protein